MKPPKWADQFLEWFCRPELLEEIQGDAYELFYRTAKESKRKADFYYIWNVIRFFRWKNIRRNERQYTSTYFNMLKNYFVIGFRNALRHGVNSSINVIGLSLAIGCAITASLFIDHQWHADVFHTTIDRVYQVTNFIQKESGDEEWSDSPLLLGPSLKESETGIEAITRIEYSGASIRHNETVFNEGIWFVDSDFTKVFTFPLLKGTANALVKKENIILTKEIAERYFGNTDPIGQVLSVKFQNNVKEDFTVGAVIEKPTNSSLYPQVLFSLEKFNDLKFKDAYDWSYLTDATFILLKPDYTVQQLEAAMAKYKKLQNAASPEWVVTSFHFQPFRGLVAQRQNIVSAVSNGAHPAGLMAIGAMAIILLVLACFNYMNVAVATAATRLKEIGIRKVLGGKKKEIIQQFLTENFLLCLFALGGGVAFSYFFFLPAFNTLFPIKTPFYFTTINNGIFLFAGLLLFVGFASGAYPAFYISSFTPITIMRGREKFGQRSLFSRVLLTVQFVLAFTAIVGSFVFIDNALHQKNRDWGYDHHQNIVVPVGDKEKFLALRDKVESMPNLESVAGSFNHIGYQNTRAYFEYAKKKLETVHFQVGANYLETMNIRLKEGRFLDGKIESDYRESVVVNEEFAEMMGWKDAMNQTFEYDSARRYVVGVISDFHYDGFYDPLGPVMFSLVREEKFAYLSLRTATGHANQVLADVKTAWQEIAPDDPFSGFLQDEVFANFYNDNTSNVKLATFISTMAIALGCLGLFGLVSFNITRRMKEFSIRKVFGANLTNIFRLMSTDYMWILIIAFVVGAPAGFLLMNQLIQHIYPEPQQAGVIPFLTAIVIMIITVAITVGSQMSRVTKENPAKTLRIE